MAGNRRLQSALAAMALLVLVPPRFAAGQALEELRQGVRTNDPAPPRDESPTRRDSQDDCYDDSCDDSGGWGELLLFAVVAPFWGPPVWAGDGYTETGYFAHFPYQHNDGYMLIGPAVADGEPYRWAFRGRAEYGTDFGDIEWTGGHVLLDTSSRWGLESDFRHVHEQAPPARYDALWLGDANIVFRFAQSEYLVMRTGLGFNFLSDPAGSNFGFNFTYGGDYFPIRPWIFSGELDLGVLGHANVFHFRGTVGVSFGLAEAFIGYDYYDVGPTQLAGLVAGVRLWY